MNVTGKYVCTLMNLQAFVKECHLQSACCHNCLLALSDFLEQSYSVGYMTFMHQPFMHGAFRH